MKNTSVGLFASIFFGLVLSGTAGTAVAQRAITVEIGKTTSFQLRRQVRADSVRVWVRYRNISKGRLDTNNNKFVIEGLNVGTTELTFSGTYREITVGDRIEERALRFTERFVVTVLPRTEAVDRQTRRIAVSVGSTKTYRASTYLGAEFIKPNEEGLKWRGLRVNRGDNSIATIDTSREKMNFSVKGIANGRTIISIRGDKMVDGVWKTVIRDLEIVVGLGVATPNNAPNGDVQLARLNREFRVLVDRARRAGADANANRLTRTDLGLFADSVDVELTKERGLLDPDENRISQLESLFEEAHIQIERLENNTTTETVNLSGVWTSAKYSSCTEPGVTESIRITQTGSQIIAVKIVGNPCVKAGEESFRGNFNQNPFDGELLTRNSDGSGGDMTRIRLFVKDPNTIELRKGSETFYLTRKLN